MEIQPYTYYNVVFQTEREKLNLIVKRNTTIKELIKQYFDIKNKSNLLVDNFEYFYFIYDGEILSYENNLQKVETIFKSPLNIISVNRLDNYNTLKDYEEKEVIKENKLTVVYKANRKSYNNTFEYVAIKKIKKDALKEELQINLSKNEIDEEDFKKEVIKFNRELKNMEKCYCENTVKLYDYFDTDKYFIIIMEICDNTLFYELCKTKSGFNIEQLKDILLQLNNAFKKMHENHIANRYIKLNNILVKYLNLEKTKFKVLLSDYGISDHLSSMLQNYDIYDGTLLYKAPEILEDEDYNDKCDIWSLGITIYYLYTKNPPYKGHIELKILMEIKKLGLSILDKIHNENLKDLLSKMLKVDPDERISWNDYFQHPFFD